MIVTNRKNLPQALVAACSNDPYSAGTADISITRLLAPPRQVALMRQHASELTEDVADRIWALRSQGIHAVLERAVGTDKEYEALLDGIRATIRVIEASGLSFQERYLEGSFEDGLFRTLDGLKMRLDELTPKDTIPNEIAEVRWERQCLNWRVSGKLDLVSLADGCLTDWKDTSVWSIKDALDPKTEGKKEWEQQVNLLAYFGLHHGYQIKQVQVVAFGRDWRKNEKLRFGEDYPDAEVTVIPLPLWDQRKAQAFLEERVAAHQQAQAGLSVKWRSTVLQAETYHLPECTPAERWEQPTVYAVHKGQNRTAVRLYGTEAEAQQHARSQPGLAVRVRPGKSPRCQQYCSALPWCDQGQRIVAAMEASA